jgi:5-methyltetrahydropteroyltriglutamate--homocysteine methyltransferase
MPRRILTTHAGSLPKGKDLTALHVARNRGEAVDEAAFAAARKAGEQRTIEKQIESGIDIVNDGEVGREGFFTYVQHRMTGFGGTAHRPIMRDITMYPSFLEYIMKTSASQEGVTLLATPSAIGEIAYRDPALAAADVARFKALLAPFAGRYEDAFVTAPSPGIIAAAMANRHYPDMESYVKAVAAALTVEYRAILAAGLTLQIDAPDLAMERHTLFADKPLADYLDFVRLVVAAINGALAGQDAARVRLHVCWGNYNGPHECDVALADIWPEIAKAPVGAHVLSLANPRHEHEVALFRSGILPQGAVLVAGTIDTTSNYVEHPELVAQRIERAVAAVGDPARVIAGTDCGFETSAGFVTIPDDVVWAKLRALRDGARLASQRLFAPA